MATLPISGPKELALVQHRGLIPDQQQDALLACGQVWQGDDIPPLVKPLAPVAGLCAVADGVAASFKPHHASQTLLELLRDRHAELDDAHPDTIPHHLQDGWIGPRALRRDLHPRLCRRLSERAAFNPSATTLAMLQWRAGRFSVLNVGDSRIYCIDGAGAWRQVSVDHTYYQSMLQRGELEADTDVAQLYHDLEHMISTAETEDDFAIHWQIGLWPAGATWLLCSDGLHDCLGQADLEALFDPEAPLIALAGRYRQAVLAAGAPDNLSLLLLR